MQFDLLLAAISVVVILGLAFYAGILISKIRMHTKLNNEREQKQREERQKRNDKICESIRVIARATAQKQCNVSEASIRLVVLLEALVLDNAINIQNEYPALSELFDKTKTMPTHDKRKEVAIKELKKLDRQRQIFEDELEDKIMKEASQLANFQCNNQ